MSVARIRQISGTGELWPGQQRFCGGVLAQGTRDEGVAAGWGYYYWAGLQIFLLGDVGVFGLWCALLFEYLVVFF